MTDVETMRELADALSAWLDPLEREIALVRDWQMAFDEGGEPDDELVEPRLRLVQ